MTVYEYLQSGGTTLKIIPRLVSNNITKVFTEFESILPEVFPLKLLFDDIINVPVTNVNSVSDWNVFFDLPINGNEFTSVNVVGNEVDLIGGSDIKLKNYLFGDSANGNNLLEIVDDANSIIECGDGVFSDWNVGAGCYNLAKIHLPVCSILGSHVFADCELLSDLVLPFDQFTALGDDIFDYCPALAGIISFPNVTTVGAYCFYDTALSEINLPKLNTASTGVFRRCSLLASVDFPELITVGSELFSDCTSLVSANLPLLNNISINCFYNCQSLTAIDLPLATTLGSNCFDSCINLASVNLPEVASIGTSSFSSCYKITSLVLDKVTTIGATVFSSCILLTTVSLASLVNAPAYCFNNASALISLNLPNLETAGAGCLGYFAGTSLDLPKLISADSYCFSYSKLVTLSLPSATTIGNYCFAFCNDLNTLSLPVCTSLGSTVLNNSVFQNIVGETITLTVAAALITCNSGDPDGDIQFLVDNNTATILDENGNDITPLPSVTQVKYGYLYKTSIAPESGSTSLTSSTDWIVPTVALWNNIVTFVGGSTYGGRLKESNSPYWLSPNTGAINAEDMAIRGGSYRYNTGAYNTGGLRAFARYMASNGKLSFQYDTTMAVPTVEADTNYGFSVRLCNLNTTLTNGQYGRYTGNDGKTYKTKCINNIEWLLSNLAETQFRNHSIIPTVTANASWSSTQRCKCAFNNDETNVLI